MNRRQWSVVRLPMLTHWLLNCASRRNKMVDHPMDTPCTNDGEPSTAPGRIPTERLSPVSLLSNPLYGQLSLPGLAAHCVRELNNYRRGQPCIDAYVVEV